MDSLSVSNLPNHGFLGAISEACMVLGRSLEVCALNEPAKGMFGDVELNTTNIGDLFEMTLQDHNRIISHNEFISRKDSLEFHLQSKADNNHYPVHVFNIDDDYYLAVIQNKPIVKAKPETPEQDGEVQSLLNSLPDLIAVSDLDGNLTFRNKAFEDYFNISDYAGKVNFFELLRYDNSDSTLQELRSRLRNEQAIQIDLLVRNVKGRLRWVQWHINHRSDNGQTYILYSGRDIHSNKLYQEALRKTEKRLVDVINVAGQFVWETDENFEFTYVSDKVRDIIGIKSSELFGKHIAVLFTGNDKSKLRNILSVKEKDSISFSGWKHHAGEKNGNEVWLLSSALPILLDNQEFAGLRGVSLDISSDQKKIESLHTSEQNYELLFNQAPIGVFSYDLNMIITDCNDSFTEILNTEKENLLHLDMRKLKDKRIIPAILAAVNGEKGEYEGEYITTLSGTTIYVSMQCVPFYDSNNNVTGGIGLVKDITKAQRAEKALKYQIELEMLALDTSSKFINLDIDNTDKSINEGLKRIGAFSGTDRGYILNLDEQAGFLSVTHQWNSGGVDPALSERPYVHLQDIPFLANQIKKGKPMMISDVGKLPEYADKDRVFLQSQKIRSLLFLPIQIGNRLSGILGFDMCREKRSWNYNEIIVFQQLGNSFASALYRRETELRLRESEDRFRSVVQNATDLITILDERGYIKYNSPSFERITGHSNTDWGTFIISEIIHPSDLNKVLRVFLNARDNTSDIQRVEFRVRKLDGNYAYFESDISNQLGNPSIKGLVVNSRDISERKAAEIELKEKQRFITSVSKTVPGILYVYNLDENRLVYTNDEAGKRIREEFTPIFSLQEKDIPHIHPDDLEKVETFQSKVRNEATTQDCTVEYRVKASGKEYRWHQTRVNVFSGGNNGNVNEILGLVQDITERKQSEVLQNTIYRITDTANRVGSVDELYKGIYDALGSLITLDNFYFAISDRSKSTLFFPFVIDNVNKNLKKKRKYTNGLTEFILEGKKAVVFNKKELDERQAAGDFKVFGDCPKSVLGIPLTIGDSIIGVIVAYTYRDDFRYTMEHKKLLQFVGEQIALTIHRKQTEELLEREKTFANALISSLPGIYCLIDEDGNLLRWNENFELISGYAPEEIRNMDSLGFFSDDHKKTFRLFMERAIEMGYSEAEADLVSKRGETMPFFLSGIKIFLNNKACISVSGIDISERLKAEEQIKSSLKEKKILLSEVHHRVKNNLAVITGLLSLQAEIADSDVSRQVLRESELRIRSMAMIHEKLYQTDIYSRVEFHSYVKDLSGSIANMFNRAGKVEIKINIGNLYLDLNKAIPCGLIINELLTNAFKHAFKGREHGTVQIDMTKKDKKVTLYFADDGVGLPESFDIETASSLGMKLIDGLTGQLDGAYSFKNDNGAKFTLTFEDAE